MVPILSSRLPQRSVFARFFLVSLCALLLAALPAVARAEAPYVPIQPGHSAMWFDPARGGEGWIVGILSDEAAALYWFTFDDEGEPRWLEGVGRIVRDPGGDSIVFSELIAPRGGRFGPDFDPAQVVREVKGSAVISFSDCQHGRVAFSAFGKSGDFPLTRLTRTMAAGCGPIHGTPGEPVRAEAGQSGGWYDPAYSGQGYVLTWLANGSAALGWFTYDPEGNPYWMVGTGEVEDDRLVFPELYSARGGRFAEAFDPAQVEHTPWGRVELSLGCDSGAAEYEATAPGFGTGRFDLNVLARLAKPACPWVKPTLTDLYDITLTHLPTPVPQNPPPGTSSGNLIAVHGVANDGTVVGTRKVNQGVSVGYRPVRLRPGETDWQDVYSMFVDGLVFVSEDGEQMLIDRKTGGAAFIRGGVIVPMPGLESPGQTGIVRPSTDFSHAVMQVAAPSPSGGTIRKSWIWSEAQGMRELPTTDEMPGATARCVSNDGSLVVGSNSGISWPGAPAWAVRWQEEGDPRYLFDAEGVPLANISACSGDARIIYGTLPVETDEDGTVYGLPGFIGGNGISGVLGIISPSEERPFGWQHVANHVSSDGTFAGGAYRSPEMIGSLPNGGSAWGAYLWTQDTGPVLLTEVLEDLGLAPEWPSMWITAMSPSGEYLVVTTGEIFQRSDIGTPSTMRSALVRLEIK
ncbi:hypothetical protein [Denitratimonas tolerans]|uniref:Uncharacterized protein n=1 Tax=Denitratimonas tolerans TaxID=1338420 RepID=A0AAW9R2F9_9GAMM